MGNFILDANKNNNDKEVNCVYIDERYFTKKRTKQELKLLGKILFYMGAIVPYYVNDYWWIYIRLWHPLSWLLVIWIFVYYMCKSTKEATQKALEDIKEILPTKERVKYNYFKAR